MRSGAGRPSSSRSGSPSTSLRNASSAAVRNGSVFPLLRLDQPTQEQFRGGEPAWCGIAQHECRIDAAAESPRPFPGRMCPPGSTRPSPNAGMCRQVFQSRSPFAPPGKRRLVRESSVATEYDAACQTALAVALLSTGPLRRLPAAGDCRRPADADDDHQAAQIFQPTAGIVVHAQPREIHLIAAAVAVDELVELRLARPPRGRKNSTETADRSARSADR